MDAKSVKIQSTKLANFGDKLQPFQKGTSGNPKGKPKGLLDKRTAYKLGFNQRGTEDFNAGQEAYDNITSLIEQRNEILRLLKNEKGQYVLFHADDIEVRFEMPTKKGVVQKFATLQELINANNPTGATILQIRTTRNLINDLIQVSDKIAKQISDINDVLGNKKTDTTDYETRSKKDEIFNQAIIALAVSIFNGLNVTTAEFIDTVKDAIESKGLTFDRNDYAYFTAKTEQAMSAMRRDETT